MIFNPYDDTALLIIVNAMAGVIDDIYEDTEAIRAQTDSEAILSENSGQITTDGTEQIVITEESPAGILEPRCFKLDFTNHTAGETVVVRVSYRISSAAGANLILQTATTYAGAVTPNLVNINLEPNRYGFGITIEKTAGANRAYDWEVFYEEAP